MAELIALAGGLNAAANRTALKLERVVQNRGTTVQDIDLAGSGAQTGVRDGDVLRVPANLAQLESSVRLAGNVFQPGIYQWRQGLRLADVLPAPELIKPMSDLNYVLIRREVAPNVEIEAVSADLQAAWREPSGPANVLLRARDTVYVFHLETGRLEVVAPLIDELQAQAAPHEPLPVVRVGGQVRAPGEYPLEAGMRISDLLRAGGGLSEAAYATDAELTRYTVVNGEYRETELVTINLAAVVRGDAAADLAIGPYDYLNIKEVSRWRGEESVTIRGEVVFPGTYPIRRGEKLSSLLARAGGLTDLAFPEGSVFTRVEIQEREREQLELLAQRLERDLATLSVTEPSAGDAITAGQALLSQLRNTVPTGRWVIRLDDIVAGDRGRRRRAQGRRQSPRSRRAPGSVGVGRGAIRDLARVLARPRSRRLHQSQRRSEVSAPTRSASTSLERTARSSPNSGAGWFQRDAGSEIQRGDSIVVPLDVDQPLARWSCDYADRL